MKWNTNFRSIYTKKEIRYLGIQIVQNIDKIAQVNFEKATKKVSSQLHSWGALSLSFLGKSNLLKMSILPKYTFLFNTIPLEFPKIWFKKVQGLFLSFIGETKAQE